MEPNISLKDYNTFGIEAYTHRLIGIKSIDQLLELLENEGLPDLILGSGSNVLFSGNPFQLVVCNKIAGKKILREDAETVIIEVGGGEDWHGLVLWAIECGLGGIENLSLIPGTVGAAPIQNIGAYGVELQDVFYSLDAVDLHRKELVVFQKDECEFDYRNSLFKKNKGRYFITRVRLMLHRNGQINTTYGAIADTLQKKGIQNPTIKDISEAVIAIRSSKLPDPKELGNAGSFFKNPIIGHDHFLILKDRFPEIVYYKISEHAYKIPAGWLIEQAGFKGQRNGPVGCYEKQALVIVNYGGADAAEVLAWVEKIEDSVKSKFGISLEREVNVV
jgi:UDP-N-acetylmuramate dehydrogenase